MTQPCVDHIMCLGGPCESVRALFEQLGFIVTPYSPIAALGGGNQCILFESAADGSANYLELVSVEDEALIAPDMRPVFTGGWGPKMLVMSVEDIAAEVALRAPEGRVAAGPLYMDRDWVVSDAEILKVSFGVYLPTVPSSSFPVNACQHFTPQHYARQDWTAHPNGARQIMSVLVVTDQPEQLQQQLLPLGSKWETTSSGSVLNSAGMSITYLSPEVAAQRLGIESVFERRSQIVGVSIAADLSTLTQWLTSHQIECQRRDGRICVHADTAQGIALEFIET